jgi:hypothetical protein
VHFAFWFYVSSFGSGTSSTPNVCSYCYPHKDVIIYTISEPQKYRNLSTNQPLMSNFIVSIVRVCDRRNRRTMFGDGDGPTLTLHRVLAWAQGQVGNLWSWSGSTSEVVLLGRPYDTSTEEGRDRFLNDFLSRILLTYRCDFPNILEEASSNPSASSSSQAVSINCDAGWGCAIRVSQMLMAQCLLQKVLGRDWRRISASSKTFEKIPIILKHFEDNPMAAFGIHNFCKMGKKKYGKAPGTWFGPTTAAQALADLGTATEKPVVGLRVITFADGSLYKDEVQKLFEENGVEGVVVVLCCKLGVDLFNYEAYQQPLADCFRLPWFQGLCGGGPTTAAHFFVGCSDTEVFYLDPHVRFFNTKISNSCQDSRTTKNFEVDTSHRRFAKWIFWVSNRLPHSQL